MPNDLPILFGSGTAGIPSKMPVKFTKNGQKTRFCFLTLLKSYFFGLSYEAYDPNFWATEKKTNTDLESS